MLITIMLHFTHQFHEFGSQGLVRAVGVSNYGPKQLLKIHDYLKSRGVPLCSAQVLTAEKNIVADINQFSCNLKLYMLYAGAIFITEQW